MGELTLLQEIAERFNSLALEQRVEFHIAANPWREVLAVGVTQRADERASVFCTNLPILIPAAVIQAIIAVLFRHLDLRCRLLTAFGRGGAKRIRRKRSPAPEGKRRDGAPKGATPSREGVHLKEGCADRRAVPSASCRGQEVGPAKAGMAAAPGRQKTKNRGDGARLHVKSCLKTELGERLVARREEDAVRRHFDAVAEAGIPVGPAVCVLQLGGIAPRHQVLAAAAGHDDLGIAHAFGLHHGEQRGRMRGRNTHAAVADR